MKIRIDIEYKGSEYYGWQKQSSGNTIQNEVEMALKKITLEKINVIGSGRTDSGVHATNQVATFNLNKKINLKGLIIKLNKELPSDIRIKSYKQVSNNFHPQHSAKNKTYIYKIKNKGKIKICIKIANMNPEPTSIKLSIKLRTYPHIRY